MDTFDLMMVLDDMFSEITEVPNIIRGSDTIARILARYVSAEPQMKCMLQLYICMGRITHKKMLLVLEENHGFINFTDGDGLTCHVCYKCQPWTLLWICRNADQRTSYPGDSAGEPQIWVRNPSSTC